MLFRRRETCLLCFSLREAIPSVLKILNFSSLVLSRKVKPIQGHADAEGDAWSDECGFLCVFFLFTCSDALYNSVRLHFQLSCTRSSLLWCILRNTIYLRRELLSCFRSEATLDIVRFCLELTLPWCCHYLCNPPDRRPSAL